MRKCKTRCERYLSGTVYCQDGFLFVPSVSSRCIGESQRITHCPTGGTLNSYDSCSRCQIRRQTRSSSGWRSAISLKCATSKTLNPRISIPNNVTIKCGCTARRHRRANRPTIYLPTTGNLEYALPLKVIRRTRRRSPCENPARGNHNTLRRTTRNGWAKAGRSRVLHRHRDICTSASTSKFTAYDEMITCCWSLSGRGPHLLAEIIRTSGGTVQRHLRTSV